MKEKKTKSELLQELKDLRKRLAELERTKEVQAPYSEGPATLAYPRTLDEALERFGSNDHLCLIYKSLDELRAASVPFLRIGFDRGEKCICITSTHSAGEIREWLAGAGIDFAEMEASGQLAILHRADIHPGGSSFDPEGAVSVLMVECDRAIAEGYPGLRIMEEVSMRHGGYFALEKLLEYEARLNKELFSRYPCTAMCQYEQWRCDARTIKNALMTHPVVIRDNEVHQNFYYVAAEELLEQKREQREVQDWLIAIEQEGEAQKRVRFLYDLLERASQPFTVSYADGHIMLCNPAFTILSGYTEAELHGMTWTHLTPPEYREVDRRKSEELHETGRPQRYEKECIRQDDTRVPIEVLVHEVRDKRGDVQYYYTFVTDIRERKRVQTELVRKEERFRSLFEGSPVSLWEEDFSEVKRFLDMLRDSGVDDLKVYLEDHPEVVARCVRMVTVIDVNSTTLALFGAKDKAELESGLERIFVEESYDAFKKELVAVSEGIHACETEVVAQTLTGERKTFDMKWTTVPGHEESYSRVVVSLTDVTESRRLERAVRKSETDLRTILDHTVQAFILVDRNGVIRALNRTANEWARRLLGKEVRVGDRMFEMVPEGEGGIFEKHFRTALQGQRVHGDRELFDTWLEFDYSPVREGNEITGVCISYLDIGQAKRARMELAKNEARYRSLVRYSSDLITVVDAEGKITYLSASVERMLGYRPEEVTGRNVFEFIHPDDVPMLQFLLAEMVKTSEILKSAEFRVRHAHGHWVYLDSIGSNLIGDRNIGGIVVNSRDVTERKKTEDALRESEARLRLYLSSAEDIIVVQDLEGKYLYYNGPRIYGLKPEQVVGKTPFDLHEAEAAREMVKAVKQVAESRKGLSLERTVIWRGRTLWFTDQLSPIAGGDGDVSSVLTISRNITERKKAEMEVEKAKAKYENLAENLGELIYAAHPKTFETTYVNNAVRKFYGYAKTYWLKHPDLWEKLIHPEDRPRVFKEFRKAVKERRRGIIAYRIVRKDGTVRWVEDHMVSQKDAAGRIVSMNGVMYDITERKQAEAEMIKRERMARERARLLADLRALDQTEEILTRVCEAVRSSGLFERAVMTLHQPGGKITHLGQVGLPRKVVEIARKAPPVDDELRRQIMSERFRISDSFFIPVEGGLDYTSTGRYVPERRHRTDGDWQSGDELFVPLRNFSGEIMGYLSADTPTDGRRPGLETVQALEMLVEAAAARVREVETRQVLKRERDFSQSVLETANSLVVCLDADGRITVFNEECERVTGYRREEVLGERWPDLFLPKEHRHVGLRSFAEWVRAHPSDRYEGPILTKGGEIRTILWSNSAILGPSKDEVVAIAIGQDITERKRVEEALRESEKRYEDLVEKERDIIYALDTKGNITFVNRAVQNWDYTPTELIGKSFMEWIPEEFRDKTWKNFQTALKTGGLTAETTLVDKKGQQHFVQYSSTVIKEKDRVVGTRGIIRDFTEHRLMEQTVREKEELYETVLRTSPDGLIVTDLEGRIIDVSRHTVESLGLDSEEEMRGKRFLELIIKSEREKGRKTLNQLLKRGTMREFEFTATRKDGTKITVETNASVLKDKDGKPVAIVATTRDVTNRKQMQDELRASEEKYRTLVENINDLIVTVDGRGIIRYVSPPREPFGFTESDLVGYSFTEFLHPDDVQRAKENMKKAMRGNVKPSEYRYLNKRGEIRWTRVFSRPLHEGKRVTGLEVILSDVTELKELQERASSEKGYLEDVFNSVADAIFVTDMKRRFVSCNEATEKLFGYKREEIVGKSAEMFHPDKRAFERAGRTHLKRIKERGHSEGEITLKRKDGTTFVGSGTASLLTDRRGNPMGVVMVIHRVVNNR